MASSSSKLLLKHTLLHILLIILTILTPYASGCYSAIFSFGDSITDTGNSVHRSKSSEPLHFALPPYGETYFNYPTGRCCDGRLILDFIAQNLGLPFVPPYFGGRNASGAYNFEKGVNFALVGANTLDDSFFEERGISNSYTNSSMRCQLSWFKDLLPSLCLSSSDCNKLLQRSLFILGEFGGNDYNRALLAGRSAEEIHSYVPIIVDAIASATSELIELGAMTVMVPGNLPFGCAAAYLTYFESSDKEEYDPIGCLIWLNNIAKHHNALLQKKLSQIRERHPHAAIIYADIFNAAMPYYLSPWKFGFTKGAITACCGAGAPPYHFNTSVACGYFPSFAFDHPFKYVNWDGWHLTEAAYRLITKGLLEGPYTIPHINTSCVSTIASAEYSNFE
ncbi:hypothetical protein F0562_013863 [Nyssa sinensis]|uniref:Sinapine esterase n=1 Tax=Nyssa sinensis TaxID=561372 RepID=A0A5J4ZRI5_9ASTE|nr:hypothetical protein F0562_013863 [Nyssa sinensis]